MEIAVEHLAGVAVVSSVDELLAVLARRVDGANHFMISAGDGVGSPMLDILVAGELAVLHFFADDGATVVQSLGHLDDAPDEVAFPDEVWLPGSAAITVGDALRAAVEFVGTLRRPSLVDWLEL